MPFEFKRLDIPDLLLIEPKVFKDSRGFFMESYKTSEFIEAGITENFLQDNHSFSGKNVLRGLHFQEAPFGQSKTVRVLKGSVFDVAVDLRKDSPSYLKWCGVELSEKNNNILYIPNGFAHGFLTLTEEAHLCYKCSNEYSQDYDSGIRWDDPDIAIDWPVASPLLSEKDENLPFLSQVER